MKSINCTSCFLSFFEKETVIFFNSNFSLFLEHSSKRTPHSITEFKIHKQKKQKIKIEDYDGQLIWYKKILNFVLYVLDVTFLQNTIDYM